MRQKPGEFTTVAAKAVAAPADPEDPEESGENTITLVLTSDGSILSMSGTFKYNGVGQGIIKWSDNEGQGGGELWDWRSITPGTSGSYSVDGFTQSLGYKISVILYDGNGKELVRAESTYIED